MFKIITFFTLILSIFTFKLQQQPIADDKILIQLYSESLCPDCLDFILNSLTKALNTKDIYLISEFKFYPYGNARWSKNGSSYTFICQHGVRQCQGNLIETCALNLYEPHQYSLPFVLCLESNTSNWQTQGSNCANQYGLDWNRINQCTLSSQGNQWQYEMAIATDNLVPSHMWVPWITVNGVHDLDSQNAILEDMVGFICNNYKGSIKIEACS